MVLAAIDELEKRNHEYVSLPRSNIDFQRAEPSP